MDFVIFKDLENLNELKYNTRLHVCGERFDEYNLLYMYFLRISIMPF